MEDEQPPEHLKQFAKVTDPQPEQVFGHGMRK
jgi:hypothetical protein